VNLVGFLTGAAFGLVLAAARLSDYDVIHKMLLLQEFDVFLLMGSAMATAAPLLWLLQRSNWVTPLGGPLKVRREPIERRNIVGAAIFGTGWAIAGTCPGPAVVMTAGGSVLGVFVMAGLLAGAALRDKVATRSTEAPAPAPNAEGALVRS
jgi:uncharacterized membrane protein YedE/YeeE